MVQLHTQTILGTCGFAGCIQAEQEDAALFDPAQGIEDGTEEATHCFKALEKVWLLLLEVNSEPKNFWMLCRFLLAAADWLDPSQHLFRAQVENSK